MELVSPPTIWKQPWAGGLLPEQASLFARSRLERVGTALFVSLNVPACKSKAYERVVSGVPIKNSTVTVFTS
jgi:hypothetical protein